MKVIAIKIEKIISLIFALSIVFCGINVYIKESRTFLTMLPINKKTIVIDPGHGGADPGKAGKNGLNEKDINLEISKKLKSYLEQGGAYVIITRDTDTSLSRGKRSDLKSRVSIDGIENADVFISIHQNSYPSEKVWGGQVFYYKESDTSKQLADKIQESIIKGVQKNNKRIAKQNDNYFILKNTKIPSVIVECGFLSNSKEEKLLNSDKYQDDMAWAIYSGIVGFFKEDIS